MGEISQLVEPTTNQVLVFSNLLQPSRNSQSLPPPGKFLLNNSFLKCDLSLTIMQAAVIGWALWNSCYEGDPQELSIAQFHASAFQTEFLSFAHASVQDGFRRVFYPLYS